MVNHYETLKVLGMFDVYKVYSYKYWVLWLLCECTYFTEIVLDIDDDKESNELKKPCHGRNNKCKCNLLLTL